MSIYKKYLVHQRLLQLKSHILKNGKRKPPVAKFQNFCSTIASPLKGRQAFLFFDFFSSLLVASGPALEAGTSLSGCHQAGVRSRLRDLGRKCIACSVLSPNSPIEQMIPLMIKRRLRGKTCDIASVSIIRFLFNFLSLQKLTDTSKVLLFHTSPFMSLMALSRSSSDLKFKTHQ